MFWLKYKQKINNNIRDQNLLNKILKQAQNELNELIQQQKEQKQFKKQLFQPKASAPELKKVQSPHKMVDSFRSSKQQFAVNEDGLDQIRQNSQEIMQSLKNKMTDIQNMYTKFQNYQVTKSYDFKKQQRPSQIQQQNNELNKSLPQSVESLQQKLTFIKQSHINTQPDFSKHRNSNESVIVEEITKLKEDNSRLDTLLQNTKEQYAKSSEEQESKIRILEQQIVSLHQEYQDKLKEEEDNHKQMLANMKIEYNRISKYCDSLKSEKEQTSLLINQLKNQLDNYHNALEKKDQQLTQMKEQMQNAELVSQANVQWINLQETHQAAVFNFLSQQIWFIELVDSVVDDDEDCQRFRRLISYFNGDKSLESDIIFDAEIMGQQFEVENNNFANDTFFFVIDHLSRVCLKSEEDVGDHPSPISAIINIPDSPIFDLFFFVQREQPLEEQITATDNILVNSIKQVGLLEDIKVSKFSEYLREYINREAEKPFEFQIFPVYLVFNVMELNELKLEFDQELQGSALINSEQHKNLTYQLKAVFTCSNDLKYSLYLPGWKKVFLGKDTKIENLDEALQNENVELLIYSV